VLPALKRPDAHAKHSSEAALAIAKALAGFANNQDVDIPRRPWRFPG
jgi:hypothetical protein